MHRLAAIGASAALIYAALTGAAFAQTKPRFDPASVARGKAVFQSNCGFCHGEDGTGNRAPDLIRSVTLNHDVDGETVGPVIRNGKPDLGMPGFPSLSATQIADIGAFLHNQADLALHSNAVPKDYPLSKLLTGNAAAGQTYFNSAGACKGCHSPTGDLKGIAAKYTPLELELKMLHPPALPVTAKVIVADGKVFEGQLANQDAFDVAIVAADGWYRSWPVTSVKIELHDPLGAHRALLEKYSDADLHNLFAYLETLK